MPDVFTSEQLEQQVNALAPHERAFLAAEAAWVRKARVKQVMPLQLSKSGAGLLMTGRGWGKTETAASWVRREAGLYPGMIIGCIAPTFSDLRGTVFEGPTGLLSTIPNGMIENYNKSPVYEITLKNKTWIRGFSAEKPDRLRGPQFHRVWGDELAAYQYLDEVLYNVDFSLRLVYERDGERIQPQALWTTTPRPLEQLREMAANTSIYQVRGSLRENAANLAESFIANLTKHEGTKLGLQEIDGLILDLDETAVIKRRWIRAWPKGRELPQFEFVYVSFDTALTEETYDEKTKRADYTACTVWGVFLFEKQMNVMLLDSWRERHGMPELVEAIRKEVRKEYGYVEPVKFKSYIDTQPSLMRVPRKPQLVIIEDKGSGISARQMLARENFKVPVHPYNPGRADKLSRLNSIAYVVAGGGAGKRGRVWIPESDASTPDKFKFASWADQFLGEVCVYNGPTSTKHDDFVDSFSQAMRWFADNYVDGSADSKVKKKPPKPPPRGNPYGG